MKTILLYCAIWACMVIGAASEHWRANRKGKL